MFENYGIAASRLKVKVKKYREIVKKLLDNEELSSEEKEFLKNEKVTQ